MKAIALSAACAAFLLCIGVQAQSNPQGQVIFRTPQEAVKYYEDLVGTLSQQVRSMQDENAKMILVINEMQKQMQVLNQSNQNLAQELATLKRQFASDADARQAQMNKMVDNLKGAISSAQQQQQAASAAAAAAQPSEMIEYTVQPGASLSLIAKAYNVSVDDIKKINGLKSDTLKVGQKLRIPKN